MLADYIIYGMLLVCVCFWIWLIASPPPEGP